MPTWERTDEFNRHWRRLTRDQKRAFLAAVAEFVADLKRGGPPRKGLRIKRFRGIPGWWELMWADDGRALVSYGPGVHPNDPHVIWHRVGTHEIFEG